MATQTLANADTGITCIVTHTTATPIQVTTCDMVTASSGTAATAGGKVSSFTTASTGTPSTTLISLDITFATSVWAKAAISTILTATTLTSYAGANLATAATTSYALNGVLTANSG
jgi:hypothetical protein